MRLARTFWLTMGFFFFLFALASFGKPLEAVSSGTQKKVEQIDAKIAELKEIKRGYEARMLRHMDQAERLQFDSEYTLETRRHLQLADENKAKAELVQREIDELERQKKSLLKTGKMPPAVEQDPVDGFEDL
jgi:hypothetical protein